MFVKRLYLALGFIVLLLLQTLPPRSVVLAYQTWNDVNALQSAFDTDRTSVTDAARALVRDGRTWRSELASWLTIAPQFNFLPQPGGDLAQVPQFASLTDALFNGVEPSLALYDSLQTTLAREKSFGPALISLAQENAIQIERAHAALDTVKLERAKLNERELAPNTHAFLRMLDRALAEWNSALRLLHAAPALLGNDAPRRYLVLAQNNDELRATGGFISAVGVLRVERGEISVEWFGDSFAVDDLTLIHPQPPAPLQKYMWASQWLMRDSNWYADFPTSAGIAQSMYERDRHVKTDGVIAVDTRFLPRLVGALDKVELAGQSLAPENVIGRLKESWQPMPPGDMSAAWFENDRKNFLSELVNGTLIRLRSGEVRTNALAQAFWRGLREKSIQLYVNDADAQNAILEAGWGGAAAPAADDYLFVVDSNVGFNKVNARVSREIRYTVRLHEQRADATAEITYTNPSRAAEGDCNLLKQDKDNTYASMEQSCYWNYVRVLAPRAAHFVSADGVTDASKIQENDAVSAFGGYAIIPRSTTQTVIFNYTLPESLLTANTYTLRVQQQAGAAGTPITIRVEIPAGYRVQGTSHTIVRQEENVIEFREMLYQDMTFKIFLNEK